jgi:ubiquinone/menaquinone biosynthesis C-methylase UbiE
MSEVANQKYLLTDQYKNASNLNARIQLHARFSKNKYGWHRWIFDQFKIAPGSRILELGCGPGQLWASNLDRIPQDWDITLSDFSVGMLQDAQQKLAESKRDFTFRIIDAQRIPFEDQGFDAVIANHMLYHVPDRGKALAEIRRVLKPGGRFYASTIGQTHMREIDALAKSLVSAHFWWSEEKGGFVLETGAEELSHYFSQVKLYRFQDALVVTEAEPLIAYMLSGRLKSAFVGEKLQTLRQIIEHELATRGSIHITKDSGLFEAYSQA